VNGGVFELLAQMPGRGQRRGDDDRQQDQALDEIELQGDRKISELARHARSFARWVNKMTVHSR
jgi:hypothetical protein